jgi:hypothetical protein
MKILLVHPEDSLELGTWASTHWDLAIDLGWSGRQAYTHQSKRLGFRITSIFEILDHQEHRRRIRELLSLGLGRLVDSDANDWWETLSVFWYPHLEQLMRLAALADQIPEHAEIFSTRDGPAVQALTILVNREIKTFSAYKKSGREGLVRRYSKAAFALRPAQIAEIAFDKWDTDYRLRRLFSPAPKPSSMPVILLPSSYGNVSRAQIAYARMLPDRHFLLVVTRRSGRLPNLPANVEVRTLASYAPRFLRATDAEHAQLLTQWHALQADWTASSSVLRLAERLHVFDGFAKILKNGLRIRDAWREVLAREPITTVFSADEYNPFTRIPSLLAQRRRLRTVFCDHGALNMNFGIRRAVSDTYLMQSEMARNYSVEWSGLSPEKIVMGGPSQNHDAPVPAAKETETKKDWIVFYSEPYELGSARTQAFFAELLPELCALASRTNRKVILKLHPFESLRLRRSFIKKALPEEQRILIELRAGPMTEDLFARAWCSLTVQSSVAVESTLNRVPCFLCRWFDASWYDYGKQYVKYGAGYPLDSPLHIREIPELIERFPITEAALQNLYTPISARLLDSVLSGK